MKDFDVSRAFYRIEYELIDSMIRNFKRHRAEEDKEGFNWEQWQVLQLQQLERYRQENPEKFGAEFVEIEQRIEEALRTTYNDAYTKEERHILGRILKYKKPQQKAGWFPLNIEKLEHLIQATKADFAKGEWSLLRRANDIYKRIIFDAQIYASAGGTYEQAVDMATKDFLRNGIDCIVYRNGARHTIQDYASMAIRTGQQRAHLMGEGDLHDQYGIHTVRVNQRTNACPLCVGWLGKVLIDDVYSGGTYEEAKALKVPTLSQAMEMGFLHPNCKDTYSAYIEGVSKPAEPWTEAEMQEIADNYNIEQAIKHNEAMAKSYERMAKWSLDEDNRHTYEARAEYWRGRADTLKAELKEDEADVIIDERPAINKMYDGTGIEPKDARMAFGMWGFGEAYDIRFSQQLGEDSKQAKFIERCIRESNIHYEGKLYRGIMAEQDVANRLFDMLDAEELAEEELIMDMLGTSSWSADKTIAEQFSKEAFGEMVMEWDGRTDFVPVLFHLELGENDVAIDVDEFIGLQQSEVLLSKDAVLRAVHMEHTADGTIHIWVDYEQEG